MAMTPAQEREAVAAAADRTCPRCGAPRDVDQAYCVECGLRLPLVSGALPALRRRWLRRLGWYPGDWVWMSLLALPVAVAGAAAAIYFTRAGQSGGTTVVAPTAVPSVAEPSAVPRGTVGTAMLPTAPQPTTSQPTTPTRTVPPAAPNGRVVWPRDRNGWTLVLISYPKDSGRESALATATRAAKARLPEVGILDSDHFSSLHPGYFVVFSGIYGSQGRAEAALRTARASGFAGAYPRPVSR